MGYYAVRAFFVLSGFVMTSALNEAYEHDGLRFWSNRLLRLLPPYYVTCVLTALCIKLYPDQAAVFMPRWGFEMTWHAIAENVMLAPLAFGGLKFRFVEPAWSVAVEMMMYFVLFVGMARSLRGALLSFAVGAAVHLYYLFSDAPFAERYFTPASALLSFSLGAALYFMRRDGAASISDKIGAFALAVWIINLFAQGWLFPAGYAEHAGYYVNTGLAALIVIFLAKGDPTHPFRKLDETLGRLSYPVFLSQWLGGFITYLAWSHLTWAKAPLRGWQLALAALPFILALSGALAAAHERFIEPLRAKVKSGGRPKYKHGLCPNLELKPE